jgi:hypothetical protein
VVFVYFNWKPRYGKVLKNQQVGTNLSSASTGRKYFSLIMQISTKYGFLKPCPYPDKDYSN